MKNIVVNLVALLFIASTVEIAAADKKQVVEVKKMSARDRILFISSCSTGDGIQLANLAQRGVIKINEATDEYGQPLLHCIIAKCYSLSRGISRGLMSYRDSLAEERRPGIEALLRAKAYINKRDEDGHTPLNIYFQNHPGGCCRSLLHVLIEHEVEIDQATVEAALRYYSSPVPTLPGWLKVVKSIEEVWKKAQQEKQQKAVAKE